MSAIIIPGRERDHEGASWWQFKSLVNDRVFSGSNNEPVLIMAESPARDRAEWVLKPLGKLGEVRSIRELVGYRFAQTLGIPVVESAIIDISPAGLAASQTLRSRFSGSVGPNFASRYLAGVTDLQHADEVSRNQRGTATEIYAWDILVDNVDRRLTRSNILVSNDGLFAIDHELTFSWFGSLGVSKAEWSAEILYRLVKEHVFSKHVGRWNFELTDFKQRLISLTPSDITRITEDIPSRWLQAAGAQFVSEVRKYLLDVTGRAEAIVDLIDKGRSR